MPHQLPTGGHEVQSKTLCSDCLLYRNINTPQDHITLQEDLRHLEDWAKKRGMRFNVQKCYILSSRSKSTHMYSLSGVFLTQVQQHPYLGVIISDDLKWGKHIMYISRKAGATVGFLRRNLRGTHTTKRTSKSWKEYRGRQPTSSQKITGLENQVA